MNPPPGRLAKSLTRSLAAGLSIVPIGCRDSHQAARPTVVVYCSVDEQFARQVLAEFEASTGIQTRPLFDTEAGKTTGLVRRIEAERGRPRADVFWSSEVFNTILLAREGLLTPYEPPTAGDVPAEYRDPASCWTGVGLRARVIAYNTKLVAGQEVPRRWRDLAEPRWKGKVAIANPLFGTTRGHVAALMAAWGEADFEQYLRRLRSNQTVLADGNAKAVALVARGEVLLCATDTDDVRVAKANGELVEAVFPDIGDGGTLLIPCSVAIVAGCPHPETAQRLVDFLASAEVERMLARSDSGNIPVRSALREELGLTLPPASKLSLDAVADRLDEAGRLALRILRE